MTKPESDQLLTRAADVLKTLPEPGWTRISDSVIGAVRSAPMSGWPIRVRRSPSAKLGSVFVSDRVVRKKLAARIRRDDRCSPSAVELELSGVDLRSIRIELAAAYGSDLTELGASVRRDTVELVSELLGEFDSSSSLLRVDVEITDIIEVHASTVEE
ncbi:hypothetical protein ABH922_003736 [Rhodococcus sp. 27YEA15]|uniref:hypothetical protein n=1 Tax=Rhodococcus sp. 27YEA15 TaxID=3156259 RepID=UPI003C7DDD96